MRDMKTILSSKNQWLVYFCMFSVCYYIDCTDYFSFLLKISPKYSRLLAKASNCCKSKDYFLMYLYMNTTHYFLTFIENYKIDARYENNLIFKKSMVSIIFCMFSIYYIDCMDYFSFPKIFSLVGKGIQLL